MRNVSSYAVLAVLWINSGIASASPLAVGAFTYQGQLKEAGQPFNGLADVTFRLFDAEVGGVQIGVDVALIDLDIVDGLMTVDLDFGPDVFPGADRWIEIQVGNTVLAPRQPVTPVPYALFAFSGNEGPEGPEGPTGPAGPEGPQGDPGPVGPQGDPGPEGAQGPEGPEGPQGVQGDSGPEGPLGPEGPEGPAGPQGDPGPAGRDGTSFIWHGPWDSTTNYLVDDVVEFSSSSYVAIAANVDEQPDSNPQSWELMAAEGAEGAQGVQGPQGLEGIQGDPGPQGPQGLQGDPGPAGPQGDPGPAGQQGPPGQDGSDALWQVSGSTMYYNAGHVGIGTNAPVSPLTVVGTDSNHMALVSNDSNAEESVGLFVDHTSPTGRKYGIVGRQGPAPVFGLQGSGAGVLGVSNRGDGVAGYTHSTTPGVGAGVSGYATGNLDLTAGVFGYASSQNASPRGVWGRVDSPTGYAGYFAGGRNYFEGHVGIGTESPAFSLHVENNSSQNDSPAVFGASSNTTAKVHGVRGDTWSPIDGSSGVVGIAFASSGETYGGFFRADSPDGYGGYFLGDRNYFAGHVGIGTTNPHASLLIKDNEPLDGDELFLIKDVNDNWIVDFDDSGFFRVGHVNSPNRTHFVVESSGNLIGTSLPRVTVASDVGGTVDVAKTYVTGEVARFFWDPSQDIGQLVAGDRTSFRKNLVLQADYVSSDRYGNVGIGNRNPSHKLTVSSTDEETVRLIGPDGNFGHGARMNFGDGDFVYLDEDLDDNLTIYAAARTAIMGGNVGIGTSVPAFKLEVIGSAGKPGGGPWSSSSDRRLKKNINNLEGSLDRLMKLRGVTFEYKDPDLINELHGTRIGMIAQEVEEVFPDWVETSGLGYKMLTCRGFEALTVEALRELREEKDAEIKSLRRQVGRLRARVSDFESLEQRMADMEARLATEDSVAASRN